MRLEKLRPQGNITFREAVDYPHTSERAMEVNMSVSASGRVAGDGIYYR